MISKQECMVLLLQLPLTECSDRFDYIFVATKTVQTKKRSQKSFVSKYKYKDRSLRDLSLHQYYHHSKQQNDGKKHKCWNIPVYTGA